MQEIRVRNEAGGDSEVAYRTISGGRRVMVTSLGRNAFGVHVDLDETFDSCEQLERILNRGRSNPGNIFEDDECNR